jgi:hypothetical protein
MYILTKKLVNPAGSSQRSDSMDGLDMTSCSRLEAALQNPKKPDILLWGTKGAPVGLSRKSSKFPSSILKDSRFDA